MILIPEIQKVLISPPRTGSTSLRHAIQSRYPGAITLYRHMEADGIPHGYDRWERVGIVRDPVERLWSLYKFCRDNLDGHGTHEWRETQRRGVDRPFHEWVVGNETVFTSPYPTGRIGDFHAHYSTLHAMPETRKSQFITVRPDLGTRVVQFSRINDLIREWDMPPVMMNGSSPEPMPPEAFDPAVQDHIERFFSWDLSVVK